MPQIDLEVDQSMQVYQNLLTIINRRGFGPIFRVCRQVHDEARSQLLLQHVFILVKLQFDLSRVIDQHSPFDRKLDDTHFEVVPNSADGGAIGMFKHYRLQLDITHKNFSVKNPSVIMIIGLERLRKFCLSISQYNVPIRAGGAFVRDLFYDLRFSALSITWSEETLLRPLMYSALCDEADEESVSSKVLLEGYDGWWDFPHVTIHNAVNKELAQKATKIMTSPKWKSAHDFIKHFVVSYQKAMDRWTQLDLAEAMTSMIDLGMLVRMVKMSKQSRSFLKSQHADDVQQALSFFSFACPMTSCSIALTVARMTSHFGAEARTMARMTIDLIPEVKEAIETYVDFDIDNKRRFYGTATLREAEACRLLGHQRRMIL